MVNLSPVSPSEIVEQVPLDQERRKNNLIAYNLQEPSYVETTTERSQSDINSLTQLFHSEFHIDNVDITNASAWGRQFKTK